MTAEQFKKQLPDFASSELKIRPPLTFRHVSARMFPLRANLDILQQLCDSFLNIVPREAGYFRAPVPYVFLAVLDYGQMGEKELNDGWFSQVEVYFGVPVEWYRWESGRFVFHDWALITPYIFVNDDVSVPVGRTIYGFPKILAKVEATPSQWIKYPLAPTMLARISTKVFPQVFAGAKLESRVFLEVETAAMSNIRAPFDASSPTLPWTIASNMADAFGGFGRDAWWLAQGMRICPIIPSAGGPEIVPEMMARVMKCFAPGENGLFLNSLNMKQFRREDSEDKICYRALTNGKMEVSAVNDVGLLGENRILLGDLSGGYSISLYEHASLPIAQTLGLESYSSWTSGGVQVQEFKPVIPHWFDVDLIYHRGTNLAWQKSDGIWRNETGEPFTEKANSAYNDEISTAIEAISGPFQFPGTVIRVLPLIANREKLQGFLDSRVNNALKDQIVNDDESPSKYKIRFRVWARGKQRIDGCGTETSGRIAYVYMAASTFDGVISKSNNVGDWAKDELSFLIPIEFQRKPVDPEAKAGDEEKGWETMGVGLVPAFTLVDNCITAFTRWEIQGIQAQTANFRTPKNVWLDQKGAMEPGQPLMCVEVETLPALGEGQNATFAPFLEITQDDPSYGFGNVPDSEARWAGRLRRELLGKRAAKQQYFDDLKIARALSIELLGSEKPFSLYTLKEFRDVKDPDKACYQAIVRVPRKLIGVSDLREIEKTLTVRLYGYPPFDIVKDLGLHAIPLEDRSAGTVYSMQALRPFYIRATVEEAKSECLIARSGSKQWILYPKAFETMLGKEKSLPIVVDLAAERVQDMTDPSHTAETMAQARLRWSNRTAKTAEKKKGKNKQTMGTAKSASAEEAEAQVISVKMAQDALDVLDAQVVIESILSREWSNCDPNARWRKGRQALIDTFCQLPVNGKLRPYTEAELYRKTNNDLTRKVGSVAGYIEEKNLWQRTAEDDWSLSKLIALAHTGTATGKASKGGAGAQQASSRKGTQAPDNKDMDQLNELVKENLRGEGPDISWCKAMVKIIRSLSDFALEEDELEHFVDFLSPVAILGVPGIMSAYAVKDKKKRNKQKRPEVPKPEALAGRAIREGKQLLDLLHKIQKRHIQGASTDCGGPDLQAAALNERLTRLLSRLEKELDDEKVTDEDARTQLEKERAHADEFAEIIVLARNKRQLQLDALLNKLSKAFQKPDFCIRRDAFREANRESLLPIEQSWDEHWYYGREIKLEGSLAKVVCDRMIESRK
jgi:hypothetical protein